MNSDPGLTTAAPEKPLAPAQNASPRQPAKVEFSTIPFSSESDTASRVSDTASRVVAQLDGLASALQSDSVSRSMSKAAPASSESMGEECLESYLRNYVQKLTGKTQDSAAPATEDCTENRETPRVEPSDEQTSPRPPTPAPEQRDQIAALRELANASAREAMAASSQVQLVVGIRRAYLEAKAASLASSALALTYFFTHANVAVYSAALLFPVALFLSCRFAWLFRCCSASPA